MTGHKPDEIDKLRADPDKDKLLARIENPADRAEINALLDNNKAGADAEHLGNLLKPNGRPKLGAYDNLGATHGTALLDERYAILTVSWRIQIETKP